MCISPFELMRLQEEAEHVVADGEGAARLDELYDHKTDGCNGENGYYKDTKPPFHSMLLIL